MLLVILALVVQSTFAEKLSIFGIKPDLILIVLAYIGIFRGQIEGTLLGFAAGFLQDVYSPGHFGVNALAKSLIGFGVGYGHGRVVTENFAAQALIIFSATLVHDTIYFLFYSGGDLGYSLVLIFRYGLPTAIYTALLGIALIRLIRLIR